MAGYVRQDVTNNIADGNIINAADFDNEYDAIEDAFHASTGHTHDGTASEGAPITKIGPVQDIVASASALTPKTDNTIDLGSAALEYKDLYIDGVANIDSLVADTADINAGTIDNVTINSSTVTASTLTSPRIGTSILDTNGNELFLVTATASAVNELTYANAATGGSPTFTASGSDTNISINLVPKGTGTLRSNNIDVATTSDSQTLTNKTISADSNTLSGIAASSFVLSNASGNIDGSAAQKAIPTGVVVGDTDTQTLTNKTLTSPTLTGPTINDGYTEEVFTVTGTTPALSPTNGSIQTWTLTGNSTPTAGTWAAGQSLTLMVDDGTARTITWTSVPVTWKTNAGNAPTLLLTGLTAIQLWKVGTTIYGARVGDA